MATKTEIPLAVTPPQPTLSEGYSWVEGADIDPREIVELRRNVNWLADTADIEAVTAGVSAAMERAEAVIGVRDPAGTLVAAGDVQRSSHTPENGELGFLAVHTDHRRAGLGTALAQERVRRADEAGITRLQATLLGSNAMLGVYRDMGFYVPRPARDMYGYEEDDQVWVRHR